MVLKHLIGTVEPTIFVKLFTAVGIFLGIASIASVSIVIGAIVGTVIGYFVEALIAPKEKEA